jgi:hypothetical protein
MTLRILTGLMLSIVLLTGIACSDDDGGTESTGSTGSTSTSAGQPPASRPDYCDELDKVSEDVDELEAAARSLNATAAQSAVSNLRTDLEELRAAARSRDDNEAVDQAAADLVGAVDGLETTLRQATQGGSLTGVIQELQIQIPAIVSSLSDLREEANCD